MKTETTLNAGDLAKAGYSFTIFHLLRDVAGPDFANRHASSENMNRIAQELYGQNFNDLDEGLRNSVEGEAEGRALAETEQPISRNTNLDKVLVLARKNLGGTMESSARACLSDAISAMNGGNHDMALRYALRSIAYSVGILHADYAKAFKASGFAGEARLVS